MPIEQGDKPKTTPYGHGKQTEKDPSVMGQENSASTKRPGTPAKPGNPSTLPQREGSDGLQREQDNERNATPAAGKQGSLHQGFPDKGSAGTGSTKADKGKSPNLDDDGEDADENIENN